MQEPSANCSLEMMSFPVFPMLIPLSLKASGLRLSVSTFSICPFLNFTRDVTGNSRRPEITQTNLVDLFLFRADSQQQILHRRNFINPFGEAGVFNAQVNDTWFGTEGLSWNGTNQSFPYYWVVARSDRGLDGSEVPQSIFSAVRE